MLQSRICLSTSGQTWACTSLYLSTNSGFSLTIWANRLPWYRTRELVGDMGGSEPGGALLAGPEVVRDQSCDMVTTYTMALFRMLSKE